VDNTAKRLALRQRQLPPNFLVGLISMIFICTSFLARLRFRPQAQIALKLQRISAAIKE
jgi:hypothetical protein